MRSSLHSDLDDVDLISSTRNTLIGSNLPRHQNQAPRQQNSTATSSKQAISPRLSQSKIIMKWQVNCKNMCLYIHISGFNADEVIDVFRPSLTQLVENPTHWIIESRKAISYIRLYMITNMETITEPKKAEIRRVYEYWNRLYWDLSDYNFRRRCHPVPIGNMFDAENRDLVEEILGYEEYGDFSSASQ